MPDERIKDICLGLVFFNVSLMKDVTLSTPESTHNFAPRGDTTMSGVKQSAHITKTKSIKADFNHNSDQGVSRQISSNIFVLSNTHIAVSMLKDGGAVKTLR